MEYSFNKASLNSDRLATEISAAISITPQCINTASGVVTIMFESELTTEQQATLSSIVTNHVPVTSEEQVREIIQNSIIFGNDLMIQFATENVLMGITQAGKTKLIADTLKDVAYYLSTGSLYEVLSAIDEVVVTEAMAPFITTERLATFKSKIETYLGI